MGIAPHFDSDLYKPFVAVLNLQAPALFHFYQGSLSTDVVVHSSVYLEARSLLLFADDLFSDLKHGIPSNKVDVIPNDVLNAQFLRRYKVGQAVSRGGEVMARAEDQVDATQWKPRLSLTVRTLAKAQDGETIETAASRDEAIRTTANFYRSVSEPT